MKFKLESFNRNIGDQDLLTDLKRIHQLLRRNGEKLTFRNYNEHGKYTAGTIAARFNSWNNALVKAGLEITEEKDINEHDLLKNIEAVWIAKGKQPVTRDLSEQPSKYRHQVYIKRFGSWRTALEKFIEFVNSDRNENQENEVKVSYPQVTKKRTSRSISDRMRFRILMRDGFTCQSCGASPVKNRGVELHVDHIIPWSKGGETIADNLETKCSQCNLGKGNAFEA